MCSTTASTAARWPAWPGRWVRPRSTSRPTRRIPSIVWIVVSWELCWYRYEVDLYESNGHVRLDGQGYELDELTEHERIGNASSDDTGALVLL